MQQAIHILQKDLRYLWKEVLLFAGLAAFFAWRDLWWVEGVLVLTAVYLISRVIHAEPIPGDTQFWITRPYRWQSLLLAKVLFILIFVNGPVLIARVVILIDSGFPLRSAIPALLWSQTLMLLGMCLPVAALAAVTADILPFIFSSIVLLAVGFYLAILLPSLRTARLSMMFEHTPEAVDWIRNAVAMGTLIALASYVLFLQYKKRSTWSSRIFAVAVIICASVVLSSMPPTFAMEIQRRLSRQTIETSGIAVGIESAPHLFAIPKRGFVQISLPLTVTGLRAGLDSHADALVLSVAGADGRTWDAFAAPTRRTGASETILDSIAFIEPSLFDASLRQGVTLRGSL